MNATVNLSKHLQKIATDLGNAIDAAAGEPIAFTLLVFTPGRASYISSASREESVREIKFLLECWAQGMPDIPAHEVTQPGAVAGQHRVFVERA